MSNRQRKELPDFYKIQFVNNDNRALLPSYFSSRYAQKKKPDQQGRDHFSSERKKIERAALSDHFAHTVSNKEHREADLYSKGRTKKVLRKNFIGERFRIFDRDPNRKSKRKKGVSKRERKRDPFARKRKNLDQPQMPKGENGLFPNGVLPKLDSPN
ncbi:MAG: hypothetical protein Kow0075_03620 [Salibacteraceae bacterium]